MKTLISNQIVAWKWLETTGLDQPLKCSWPQNQLVFTRDSILLCGRPSIEEGKTLSTNLEFSFRKEKNCTLWGTREDSGPNLQTPPCSPHSLIQNDQTTLLLLQIVYYQNRAATKRTRRPQSNRAGSEWAHPEMDGCQKLEQVWVKRVTREPGWRPCRHE